MKRIINGKRYNTATAAEIAIRNSSCGPSDFAYYEDRLYRTSSGNYFVAGEGGPMSHWSVPVGSNGTGGGSGIRPLTAREALNFLECLDEDIPEGCPELAALVVDA